MTTDDDPGFDELLARVMDGDFQATESLIKFYLSHLKRIVRQELNRPNSALRPMWGSSDFTQIALGKFFEGLGKGNTQVRSPRELSHLLTVIVTNHIRKEQARARAAKRAHRRRDFERIETVDPPSKQSGPSEEAARNELYAIYYARLSADEHRLIELRHEGHSWAEVAALVGGEPDAVRMSVARCLARVYEELNAR